MIRCRVMSRELALDADTPEVEAQLRRLVTSFPSRKAEREPTLRYDIRSRRGGFALSNGAGAAVDLSRDEILAALMQELTAQWVQRSDLALLHAGVVVRGDRALVIAGPSGRGKSTLTAGLVRAGCTYFSDELAPILQSELVLGYPFPLRLRDDGVRRLGDLGPALTKWDRPAQRLGERLHFVSAPAPGPRAAQGVPIAMVAFPLPPARGSEPRLRDLAPGTGAFRLMAEMLNFSSMGRDGFELATRLAQRVPCVELEHGDVDATVRAVLQRWEEIP